jgi:hypothetical protein
LILQSDDDFDIRKHTAPKSDQLNAEDFIGGPRTFTIARVRDVGGTEQPVEIDLDESKRPWKPCKTTMRVMAHGWGPRTGTWRGRQVTLYRDPTVTWGGAEIGGIRVSAMSDLDGDARDRGFILALAKSKKAKAQIEVRPIKRQDQPAQTTPPKTDEPAAASPDLLAKAELAAQQGTVTLEGWWRSCTKEERLSLQRELEGLKAKAREADQRGAPTEGDPFTAPEDERMPGED